MMDFLLSFRCYFPNGNNCTHYQQLHFDQIPKWIECYKFTHPDCVSISVKVWFDQEVQE